MARALTPFAICYDFDGTLAPGNMQERDFIPSVGMNSKSFWAEVKKRAKDYKGDDILIYMGLMLEKANSASKPVQVRRLNFVRYGRTLELFAGVKDWFPRINNYGNLSGLRVSHHIISSGIREMITGTPIKKYFENIYASSYCYDQHDVAKWPALALNYTTKTQYLFRINKGIREIHDHDKINKYVPPDDRPVPFRNMVFIGDGETDIPCFRLVKDQGGHSIAVFKPHSRKGKTRSRTLFQDGRVNFIAPADYRENKDVDLIMKAIMEKVAANEYVRRFTPS